MTRVKLEPRTFNILWDVHAWVGVVPALLSFVMFFMGVPALFMSELDVWEATRSSRRPAAEPTPLGEPLLNPMFQQLLQEESAFGKTVQFWRKPTSLEAYVDGNEARGEGRRTFALAGETRSPRRVSTDGEEGPNAATPTAGRLAPLDRRRLGQPGRFLYQMHYLEPIPYGKYVAGVASMALLLALVTGVMIHLKDLVRQWTQFRPERSLRTWSSDVHKVLGVFGLPYQLLYAWTGAILCLSSVAISPVFTQLVFGGDERAARATQGKSREVEAGATGVAARVTPDLDRILARARSLIPGLDVDGVRVRLAGDEASTVSVYGSLHPQASREAGSVHFSASDGKVLHVATFERESSAQRVDAWIHRLHFARFGGYLEKVMYALLALGTCVVLVTGNLVWLERRDPHRTQRGNRILERLTIGFCGGLPVATGVMFVASCSLPVDVQDRSFAEQSVFWVTWALAILQAFFPRSSRQAAGWQLMVAGAAFLITALLDVAMRPRGLLGTLVLVVDSSFLLVAAGFAGLGLRLSRPEPQRGRAPVASHRVSSMGVETKEPLPPTSA